MQAFDIKVVKEKFSTMKYFGGQSSYTCNAEYSFDDVTKELVKKMELQNK